MKDAPREAEDNIGKQLVKSFALAAWIVAGLAFWGGIGAAAYLGSGMAEPPPPNANFTMLYVLIAFVILLFIGWCAATRALTRTLHASASVIWLAILFALLPTALFLS